MATATGEPTPRCRAPRTSSRTSCTHAVTTCNADLDYLQESGALNEAFTDIMGTSAEYDARGADPSRMPSLQRVRQSCADWWIARRPCHRRLRLRAFAASRIRPCSVKPSHYSQRIYRGYEPATNAAMSTTLRRAHEQWHRQPRVLSACPRRSKCALFRAVGPHRRTATSWCPVGRGRRPPTSSCAARLALNNTSNFCDARTRRSGWHRTGQQRMPPATHRTTSLRPSSPGMLLACTARADGPFQ